MTGFYRRPRRLTAELVQLGHEDALRRLLDEFGRQMGVTWELLDLDRLDETRAQWLRQAVAVVSDHQRSAAEVAAEFCRDWSVVHTGQAMDAVTPDLGAAVSQEVAQALDRLGPAGVKERIGRGISPEAASRQALEAVRAAGGQRVLDVNRQTIMRSAAADPRSSGWRRVTHGGCKFCRMLAGRGEVYGKESVRFASHDHCRCTAVPAYGGQEVSVHQYAASKAKVSDAEREQLRRYLGGLEDDGLTPVEGVEPGSGLVAGRRRRPESVDERYARQQRLRSDMSDLEPRDGLQREVLESHELDFLEHLEARGERVRWIRRDPGRRSTNDFVWETNGEVCELKVSRNRYQSIRSHIRDAVVRARDGHGVVKDVFVIDIGRFRLSEKLRHQLSRYNQRVEDGQIRRMFVMSEDGARLEEIDLA